MSEPKEGRQPAAILFLKLVATVIGVPFVWVAFIVAHVWHSIQLACLRAKQDIWQ